MIILKPVVPASREHVVKMTNAEKLFNEGLSLRHYTRYIQKELEEIETCISKTIRRLFGVGNYASSAMLWKLAKTSLLKQLCYTEAMKLFVNIMNSTSESKSNILFSRKPRFLFLFSAFSLA